MYNYKKVIITLLLSLMVSPTICLGDSSKPSEEEIKGSLFNIISSDFKEINSSGGFFYGQSLWELVKVENIKVGGIFQRLADKGNKAFVVVEADVTIKVTEKKTGKVIMRKDKSTNTYRFTKKDDKWYGDIMVRKYKPI
jgi:16S rRNA G966 N2-methylase RsmD